MHKFKFELQPAEELDPEAVLFFLTIKLISCFTNESKILVKLVLENKEQLEWFIKNKEAIKNDICPCKVSEGLSIAESINQAYETLDWDDLDIESKLDNLYEFRSSHEIGAAFKGQDCPDIWIALNQNRHEISCSEGDLRYRYDIDINSLFIEVVHAKKKYEIALRGYTP